ncbi:protein-methionine sulfoxide oxidase mical3b-like isoform X6 [Girardinichthys multiradiatus]|uniref:protein-methionine sulfoxide oxidase mical3b-like isoform X6 n=1 Tax=Girardinichthys multiradiatus TaxID=208333 RepID=UPI001FABDB9B|nr:protein-methionine sulfoxide oxidase mical3b-like isoform X6 [Girardinichthys multiradiatus]
MGDESYPECRAQELFDEFVSASTCRAALHCFSQLCEHLQLDHNTTDKPLYQPIKQRLNYWKANALWAKLDRRAAQQEYQRGRVCSNMTCVIIGAGPCGLRTAVELCFMGARVVVLEKRDSFSRNNVLHLWPFTIYDLRGLGAKKFYGKFCAGSIDHISIRQLQLVLLKVALLLGVKVHVNVEFKQLVEPPEDQLRNKEGWKMEVSPKSHPVNKLEFDVMIGADGRRNTLPGFRRKEFRGKLAIAITANFKNRNTSAEAKVEEISGVAFIFNQRFFQELRQETGIDLENIVYYKDDTHYFVMTAKKQSLLNKGVILQDFGDTEQLLSRGNVDQEALQAYAREAADFSTNHQLPILDFAMNHYGQPDVAMFDFTCMYASENAAMIRQRHGHQLLVSLVGDSLLEPFWPMGTGVARGFLAALDSAWMIRSWAQGGAPLDVLAERESLYRLLPQTTPENMQKSISLFTVDPVTRYMNISPLTVTPAQVKHLVDTGKDQVPNTSESDIIRLHSPRLLRQDSFSQSNQLLTWCQQLTRGYRGVIVCDLTTSWKNGLALCALIHRCRPDLIDYDSLDESSVEENVRLAFDMAEREFGISPLMTVEEMSSVGEPDSLSMVMYLSQFYQLHKESLRPAGSLIQNADLRAALITPASLLSRLGASPSRRRNPKEHGEALGKRRRMSQECGELQESCDLNGDFDENFVGGTSRSRVRLMANQLQAKLDESSATCMSSSSSSAYALRQQQGAPPSLPSPSESANHQQVTPPVQASSWRPKKRTFQQEQMSFRFRERIKSNWASSRDEQCLQMYTGGVSSLAEQIASRIQHQQSSLVSVSSDVCFFCKQRVYVMERLSAEGLFFHRSCFRCGSCSAPLRLVSYSYDQDSGTFHCLQYPDCELDAPTPRKRPTPSASLGTSTPSLSSAPSLSDSLTERRRSSAASVMMATPERIELENCRKEELQEKPEEVSEEVLNRFNLSVDEGVRVSSEEEEGEEGPGCVSSQEATSAWRETLLPLRGEEEEEREENESSDELEFSPYTSRTPVQHGSASSLQPCISCSPSPSITPPTAPTPSTASFVTSPDSTPDSDIAKAPLSPVIVMETTAKKGPTARGRGSFDDITPELPQKKALLQQEDSKVQREEEMSDGVMMRRRHREAQSLPPSLLLPFGCGAFLLHLKEKLREAPPPAQVEFGGGGARGLLKAVIPGNRENQKRRGGTLPAEKPRGLPANQRRVPGEESDLDSLTLLQRCSLKPRNNLQLELFELVSELQKVKVEGEEEEEEENQPQAYVPHALAFRRSYGVKRKPLKDRVQDSDGQSSCPTEVVGVLTQPKEPSSLSMRETMFQKEREDEDEDLDTKITRRVQRAARRQAKKDQLKRLHKAQMIQLQLQQVEVKQRELEERGVMVEKALRGEADYWEDSSHGPDMELHLGGLGKVDNLNLMQQWFQLVQQKNSLVRYESELMIFARELQLEDRQSCLQQELRERMAVDDHLKDEEQLAEERLILEEMLEVVEQRDALVSLLEEQRLLERQEDQDLEQVLMAGGLALSWT